MPLNKTKELAQVVDESILPLEHSGGDGWTILHGDTLQIIRAFKPQVFDALITDPPTLRAVEALGEKPHHQPEVQQHEPQERPAGF